MRKAYLYMVSLALAAALGLGGCADYEEDTMAT